MHTRFSCATSCDPAPRISAASPLRVRARVGVGVGARVGVGVGARAERLHAPEEAVGARSLAAPRAGEDGHVQRVGVNLDTARLGRVRFGFG